MTQQESSLLSLLRALQLNQHVEVSIGVLYTLNRLACCKPHVVAFLRCVRRGVRARRSWRMWRRSWGAYVLVHFWRRLARAWARVLFLSRSLQLCTP